MSFKYIMRPFNGKLMPSRVARTPEEFKKHFLKMRVIVPGPLSTPCWNWVGHLNNKGYGITRYLTEIMGCHRVSWIIFNGAIPVKMEVCHECDNPACYNPSHLFLGTHIDNMRDAFKKSRVPPRLGELHGMSKLTNNDVLEIRKKYIPRKITAEQLSKEFGICKGAVRAIVERRNWKHI